MKKVNSRADLVALREQYRDSVLMRLLSYDSLNRTEVTVSMAECGIAAGAKEIFNVLFDEVNNARLDDVSVFAVDCMGSCDNEPMVKVAFPNKPPVVYKKVDANVAKEIVKEHLIGGKILTKSKMEV